MPTLEEAFTAAVANGSIPGAVLMATNASGSFQYAQNFGYRSPQEKEPLQLDDMMAVFSCTKLVTTIAALQLVERGLLELDADIGSVLPEVADLKILVKMENNGETVTPVWKDKVGKITLRYVLLLLSIEKYERRKVKRINESASD
jgi:CubicO group peptidase (beta-lactamase class C family)